MVQEVNKVFVDAMYDWNTDELIGCMMDEFTLVTQFGKHIISQELWMTGEDYRMSQMCPIDRLHGMSDLDIFTQELFAKYLRCDCFFELDYKQVCARRRTA